jgi:hypothetical protein
MLSLLAILWCFLPIRLTTRLSRQSFFPPISQPTAVTRLCLCGLADTTRTRTALCGVYGNFVRGFLIRLLALYSHLSRFRYNRIREPHYTASDRYSRA